MFLETGRITSRTIKENSGLSLWYSSAQTFLQHAVVAFSQPREVPAADRVENGRRVHTDSSFYRLHEPAVGASHGWKDTAIIRSINVWPKANMC